MIRLILVLLTVSCTTPEVVQNIKQDALDTCPYVPISYARGTVPDFPVDEAHHRAARAGCVRHYGAGACLSKITKTADRTYQVICKRGN